MQTILLIDDDEPVRETIAANLEDWGYAVETAQDGLDGLNKLANAHKAPAMIITDIIMPNMEGFTLIKKIRNTGNDIKILAMSGGGGPKEANNLETAKKIGADMVIGKPFDMYELEEMVATLSTR